MRVRSYGEILSYVPTFAARRDGIFVASEAQGAVGRVVEIVPCDEQQLAGLWATWVVDLMEEPVRTLTTADTSSTSSDIRIGIQLPLEATCGLIISRCPE